MPPQSGLRAGALSNEVLAVIGEQADFQRLLVQVRDGELVDAVSQTTARAIAIASI